MFDFASSVYLSHCSSLCETVDEHDFLFNHSVCNKLLAGYHKFCTRQYELSCDEQRH